MTVPPLKLLLVDQTAARGAGLLALLELSGHAVVGVVTGLDDLEQQVRHLAPDVVLIEADCPDRDTLEHLAVALAGAPRPVILGSDRDDNDFIRAAVQAGVSTYVVDGIARQRLAPLLAAAVAHFETLQGLRDERDQAKAEVANRKLIERAKGIVMRTRRCDEASAFRALQRTSQERGVALAVLAEQVIRAADALA